MVVKFEEKYLSELYETGMTTDKKFRFQPEIIRKYIRCIKSLETANSIESLYSVKSLNYKIQRELNMKLMN
jgi:proteic killer suppression protein